MLAKNLRHFKFVAALIACVSHGASKPAPAQSPTTTTLYVSVRTFKVVGSSFFRLQRWSAGGRLLASIEAPPGTSDKEPQFSPDGTELVFARYGLAKDEDSSPALFRIDASMPATKPARLAATPQWYHPDDVSPGQARPSEFETGGVSQQPTATFEADPAHELISKNSSTKNEQGDPIFKQAWYLRDDATSQTTDLSTLPGFGALQLPSDASWSNPWITELGKSLVAIFSCHLDSTNKECVFALNVAHRQFARLSPNGGGAFPTGDGTGFYFKGDELYQPLGNGHTTVNCSYLDFWDEAMKRTRYAQGLSQMGGAAIWRPGRGAMSIPE